MSTCNLITLSTFYESNIDIKSKIIGEKTIIRQENYFIDKTWKEIFIDIAKYYDMYLW